MKILVCYAAVSQGPSVQNTSVVGVPALSNVIRVPISDRISISVEDKKQYLLNIIPIASQIGPVRRRRDETYLILRRREPTEE